MKRSGKANTGEKKKRRLEPNRLVVREKETGGD